MKYNDFLIKIKAIRTGARTNLRKGAVTPHYPLDLDHLCEVLNAALATELVCGLRYKQHHFKALELGASIAAEEFLEHANQEQSHADMLANRIVQLGGLPNYNPSTLSYHSHADYIDCNTIDEMIKENLIAERIAIDIYRELIQFIGNKDSTTRKLLEDILALEEEHADDLLGLAAEYTIPLDLNTRPNLR